MTDAYLKSWLDRVERLEEEQRGVGSDKRDLYAEAKGKGYNVKALRRIVAGRRRKDEREVEAEIDRYKIALGLAVDLVRDEKLSLRDAAKRAGVSKSSVHRALAVPAVSHDPETGEVLTVAPEGPVTSDTVPFDPNVLTTFTASEVAVPPGDGAAPASNDAAGTPSPSIEESCGDEGGPSQPAMRGEASAFVETGGAALAASPQAGVEPGPQDTDPQSAAMDRMVALGQEIDADDLAIPPFLRGSRQRVAA